MKPLARRLLDGLPRRRALVPPITLPDDPATLNRLGDQRLRERAEDDALGYFLRAADAWARDGFYAKSIAVYRKVLRLRPDHAQARERLTWTYWASGLPIDTPR